MTQPDQASQQSENQPAEHAQNSHESTAAHPIAQGVGATGGGIAGAAIGNSIGGKVGATVGGIAGAIAGGIAGKAVATFTEEALEEIEPAFSLGLGADLQQIELPAHYSWEELQALSQPQLRNR